MDQSVSTKGHLAPDAVNVEKTGTASPPYHKVFVLCVGINNNPGYGDLHFAISDATAVADTFSNLYGFTNITLLTDSAATRSNILATLDDIRSQMATNNSDDFIFYFSGHGDTWSLHDKQDGKTNLTRIGFLVAYGASTNMPKDLSEIRERDLEISVLATNIINMPARHRLVFLDSCFSGLAYLNQHVVEKQADDFNPKVINHPTVEIMTAGLGLEQAVEDAKDGHGIFTAALLKQLTSDNVLTMEEVFFPLRVSVRNSLHHVEGGHVMTPQLRYLLYENGTFLFVPTDQLSTWADTKSDNENVETASAKGYLRPVSITEATNVLSSSSASPEEKQAMVDRYEARSAMGDPLATIALAQIYQGGLGVPPDAERAKVYTSESSDLITAATTLNIAAFAGITNPVLQSIVGGLLKGYNVNDLFRFRGSEANIQTVNLATQIGTKVALPAISAIGKWTTGIFTRSPIKKLTNSQKKLVTWLSNPTPENVSNAKKELIACEDDLTKMATLWPSAQKPAEMDQLTTIVQNAETHLDQNLPDQAGAIIAKAEPIITSLQQLIKTQTAANDKQTSQNQKESAHK